MKIKLDSQDKSYVSRVKSRVKNHNRQTFDVTDLNRQTVMLGSEGIVGMALALRETFCSKYPEFFKTPPTCSFLISSKLVKAIFLNITLFFFTFMRPAG